LTRQWTVGDGGDDGNSGGNGSEGRCYVEKMVDTLAEATAEKMAVAKATATLTVEARARATMAKTAEIMQRRRWQQHDNQLVMRFGRLSLDWQLQK
jgi:hypothetical protein